MAIQSHVARNVAESASSLRRYASLCCLVKSMGVRRREGRDRDQVAQFVPAVARSMAYVEICDVVIFIGAVSGSVLLGSAAHKWGESSIVQNIGVTMHWARLRSALVAVIGFAFRLIVQLSEWSH